MPAQRKRWCLAGVSMILWIGLAGAAERAPEKFKEVMNKTAEEVKALVGEPDAHYFDGRNLYWMYDVVTKESDGEKLCPELMFRGDKTSQINYIPEATMKKGIQAARGFADFEPAKEVEAKTFVAGDTAVLGMPRAEIEKKLGRPDFKKIFNGIEVWVYGKVKLAKDQDREISIYIEFDGEKCSNSVGN